ncbi:hypothetical protein Ade02nite_80980 [Paractinoplanes deccanensis]|uniref:histidine kinase n=1 Tax=Paractinoplanes deccanensis TaxID=113561 RepID=A0ABQ3YHI6_9ACTN|nr:ATP-binding protein [Actinoplanes deccanensis]GID79457.1 hypothetical protein Ade02nite_80980 [Actinoplanes deccanensis]
MRATLDPAAENLPVPAASALTVNRVVQEALSNAARHAPGSTVHVEVTPAGGALHVRVRNTAATRPARPDPNRGAAAHNGLTGMRQRVTAIGGTLRTGPAGDGGFEVNAVVPLTRDTAPRRDRSRWLDERTRGSHDRAGRR